MRRIGEVFVGLVLCLSSLVPSPVSSFTSCPLQQFGVWIRHCSQSEAAFAQGSTALFSTLVPLSGEAATEDGFDDDASNEFIRTDLMFSGPQDASIDDNYDDNPFPKEEDETTIVDFVNRIQDCPTGQLSRDEVLLMPEAMEGLVEKNNASSLQQVLFRKVEEFAVRSESEDSEEILEALQPTNRDFLLAIKAWIESSNDDLKGNLPQIIRIFQMQDKLFEDGTDSAKPDMETCRVVLRALSTTREPEFTGLAFDIFNDMEFKYNLDPDQESYLYLIRALAKTKTKKVSSEDGTQESLDIAERILYEALGRFPPEDMAPLFKEVLIRHAKSKSTSGAEKAEMLVSEMTKNNVKLDLESYNLLIEALANEQTFESVCASDELFNDLLAKHLNGEKDALEPNLVTWTLVMSAWNRLSRKGIKIANKKTEKMLKRMIDLHTAGRTSVQPDSVALGIVLSSFARNKSPEKAQKLLDESYARYMEGDESVKPSLLNVRAVIEGWTKVGTVEGMQKADSVLEQYKEMDGFFDDSEAVEYLWKLLLMGWAKAKDPERAHFYLSDMISRGMKPDTDCFHEIIHTYSFFTREGERSFLKNQYAVFSEMEEYRRTTGFQPEERVFSSFVRALMSSEVPDLAKKANVILRRMVDQAEQGIGVRPTVMMYNAVLYACSQSRNEDPEQAFRIAVQTFKQFRSRDDNPDHATLSNFIRCGGLLPEGEQRDSFIKSAFGLAAKRGFVGRVLIQALQSVASEELWRSLTGVESGGEVEIESLPEGWWWRTKKRNKPRKRRGRKPQHQDD